MIEYKMKNGNILKDGHTMFLQDVVKDLNRKAYLEDLKSKTDGGAQVACSDLLDRFFQTFEALQKDVHQNARDKGWWDTDRNDGELLALMHSELSEALEALRAGNPPDDKVPAFSGVTVELADVVIRIMDYAEARGWSVAGAIVAKMEFNKTREHKHGGKRF